jgi:hypothetical protein
MVAENTWGAPRIHGELKMLGYKISERTVLRWMQKAPRNPKPARHWAGAEISQGLLGASDRTLGVNDPVVVEESAQPCSKRTGLSQVQEAAVEVEITMRSAMRPTFCRLMPTMLIELLLDALERTPLAI